MAIPIEDALRALGEVLESENRRADIVVVGGATLNLLGVVQRATNDIDVIATIEFDASGAGRLRDPVPLPAWLSTAIERVGRDLGLPAAWMNTGVAAQWLAGLPRWTASDIEWRRYRGLHVGLASRRTLIALKLFAAVDSGPRDKHVQDLVALAPTDAELEEASAWVATQDEYEGFTDLLTQVIEHVRSAH